MLMYPLVILDRAVMLLLSFSIMLLIGCSEPYKIKKTGFFSESYPADMNQRIPLDVWLERAVFKPLNEESIPIHYYAHYTPYSFHFYLHDPVNAWAISENVPNNKSSGKYVWDGTNLSGALAAEGFYQAHFTYKPWSYDRQDTEQKTWLYVSRRGNPANVELSIQLGAGTHWGTGVSDADVVIRPNQQAGQTAEYVDLNVLWNKDKASVLPAVNPIIKGSEYSGGHHHVYRPVGQIIWKNDILDPSTLKICGKRYGYYPPAIGGRETVFFLLIDSGYTNAAGLRINIKQDNLVVLGEGYDYELVGGTATHLGPPESYPLDYNHWGVQGFVDFLPQMAAAFRAQFDDRIRYNDMSLPFGGIFDISGTWLPPHSEHREGKNCDVGYYHIGWNDSVDLNKFNFIRNISNPQNVWIYDERAEVQPHIHLRYGYPGYNQ